MIITVERSRGYYLLCWVSLLISLFALIALFFSPALSDCLCWFALTALWNTGWFERDLKINGEDVE